MSDANNKWRDKQRSKGLCIHCNCKVEKGRKMCSRHLKYNRDKSAKLRASWKKVKGGEKSEEINQEY